MPRRYPRLQAKDREGQLVAIPLPIAPRLLPEEQFTCPSQEKVNRIAEAHERVESQKMESESQSLQDSPLPTLSPPAPQHQPQNSKIESRFDQNEQDIAKKSIEDPLWPLQELSIPSTPQGPVRTSKSIGKMSTSRSKKTPGRLWTTREDGILISAVIMNRSGPSIVGRIPNRSRNAVLKRFYFLRQRMNGGKKKQDKKETAVTQEKVSKSDGKEDISFAVGESERNSAAHTENTVRIRIRRKRKNDSRERDMKDNDGDEGESVNILPDVDLSADEKDENVDRNSHVEEDKEGE